ncbi:MAG: hypothetical protein ABIB98_00650 [bacterium]
MRNEVKRINFLDFRNRFKGFILISTFDIKKSFPNLHRRRLYEWVYRGLIKHVFRGFYIFSDLDIEEFSLFYIGNKIYEPSYISLQSAFSYYSLIPEYVSSITCISSKKTTTLKTGMGTFLYFSIKPSLMFGYNIVQFGGHGFKMACPEKALLDFLYINSTLDSIEKFEELRINTEIFNDIVDKEKLREYLCVFNNKALESRVKEFMRFIENA